VRTIEITNQQIRALRTDAAEAGDLDQVAICDVALAGVAHGHTVEASGRTWTQEEARAECARVVDAARAQE
jgi:hypothetical protein